MNWTEILGLIGGGAGIVALIKAGIDVFNARSNRNTVDLGNMQTMLNDALARCKTLEEQRDSDRKEMHDYLTELRSTISALTNRVNNMEKVVNVAWRCDYAPKVEDCPVVQEYEKRKLCEQCEHGVKEA